MLSNWNAVLERIATLRAQAEERANAVWFRGHRDARWTLKSTLHRRIEYGLTTLGWQLEEEEKIRLMRDTYKAAFHHFKQHGWPLLTEQERTPWGLIFTMQHHGMPTRLLDWTENFACALYFAQLNRRRGDDAALFVLTPETLNERNISQKGVIILEAEDQGTLLVEATPYHPGFVFSGDDSATIAVAPVVINSRLAAQKAAFTLAGSSFTPLEEQYPHCIEKVALPADTFDDANQYLSLAGLGPFGYFPDLTGLRDSVLALLDRDVELCRRHMAKEG